MNISRIFQNAPDLNVSSIMCDSRVKSRRAIFFCEPGLVNDGHNFVDEAIANGAICVVHSRPLANYNKKVIYIRVEDTVSALNDFSAFFYGNPSHRLLMTGVTGTSGKASIAWAIRWLTQPVMPCGYFGNVGILYGEVQETIHLPIPTVVQVHQTLAEMKKAKVKACALEVPSRGIDMHRYDAVHFDCAVFSNLGHEHLDYHGTMENYYRTKLKLFRMIQNPAPAIINIDDPYGKKMVEDTTGRPVTYAIERPADYQACNVRLYTDHTTFTLINQDQRYEIKSNLLGLINVYNMTAAIAAVHETTNQPLDQIVANVSQVPQVAGRMQNIKEGQPFTVLVDTTRSPDGFISLFSFLRSVTPSDKRIISVFGASSGRDVKRRAELGAVAEKYCALIILTSEDPRLESAESIAAEIQSGISEKPSLFVEDRYDAIRQSIELANEGDTVVIIGKGSDDFMLVNNQRISWMGDANACKRIIKQVYSEEIGDDEHDEN